MVLYVLIYINFLQRIYLRDIDPTSIIRIEFSFFQFIPFNRGDWYFVDNGRRDKHLKSPSL